MYCMCIYSPVNIPRKDDTRQAIETLLSGIAVRYLQSWLLASEVGGVGHLAS